MEKVKTIGELYMHIVYERSIKIPDLLSLGPYVEPPEEKRRRDIENRWYERKLARARAMLAKMGVDASELCDCDY